MGSKRRKTSSEDGSAAKSLSEVEAVVAAPLSSLDEVSAREPEHPHVATGLVSHAKARLQRVEVIRFNIGYETFETLVTVFVQRKDHTHPVEPLAAIRF